MQVHLCVFLSWDERVCCLQEAISKLYGGMDEHKAIEGTREDETIEQVQNAVFMRLLAALLYWGGELVFYWISKRVAGFPNYYAFLKNETKTQQSIERDSF